MKRIIPILSFFIITLIGTTGVNAQDFIFTEVPNPADKYYDGYVGHYDEVAFLTYRDLNYNRSFHSFDGDVLTEIESPEGFMFNWSLAQLDNTFYLTFYDELYNNVIMSFQEGEFSEIQADFPDEELGYYAFTYEDQVYITYYNFFNFLYSLKVINDDVVEDVPLPEGYFFGNSIGQANGIMYVTLNDEFWNSYFYSFDGNTFQEVTLPEGTSNPWAIATSEEYIYLSLYDQNFNNVVYTFDGTNFEQLDLPDWVMGVSYIGELDGNLFFRFDDQNYEGILFELDGDDWIETPNPAGHYLGYGSGFSESALYPVYIESLTYVYKMGVYDGVDLTVVDPPFGFTYSTFFTDNEDGAFVSFYDPGFYSFLFFYDGTELIQMPIPDGQDAFNYFEFAMDLSGDKINFFSFRDFNYNNTLYWFGEPNAAPTAADNAVYTLEETPYSFETADFNFSDIDLDDTLAAIQIVQKPSVGILHLNGANLATGQVIEAQYLDQLTYVPMNDGLGEPYDSFLFKVFDGDDFSEEIYTMYINVVETIVSTEDQELVAALNLYPNPATDFLNIDIGDYASPEKVHVYLYDNTGLAIRAQSLSGSQTSLDVSYLPRGVYSIVFRTEGSINKTFSGER